MSDTVKVRTGTPDDVHRMMAVALSACEDNGLTDPDPLKLLNEIWSSLNLHHGIVGIIGEPGKPIEAAVLLRVEIMWYAKSDKWCCVERAIFVHPDFRAAKGGRASRLIEFSKQAADKLGLPLIIGILSSERTAAKVRMYRRQLGEPSGAYWILGGHTGLST